MPLPQSNVRPAQIVVTDEVAKLQKRIKTLLVAMQHVVDELEEDFDVVDGDDGQPRPNKAMRLAHELEEAIHGPGGF